MNYRKEMKVEGMYSTLTLLGELWKPEEHWNDWTETQVNKNMKKCNCNKSAKIKHKKLQWENIVGCNMDKAANIIVCDW